MVSKAVFQISPLANEKWKKKLISVRTVSHSLLLSVPLCYLILIVDGNCNLSYTLL